MENQELMALTGNLESIIEQIKQLTGETEPMAEESLPEDALMEKILKILKENDDDEVEKKDDDEEVEKKDDDEEIEKADDDDEVEKEDDDEEVEKSEADVATASEDSQERIEDQPEMNQENIDAVAKAISLALSRKVRKSNKKPSANKEIENLRRENKEIRKTLESILEGLGIADEIKKNNQIKKSNSGKKRPMNDQSEIKKTLDEIKSHLGQSNSSKQIDSQNDIRKSLTGNDGELLKGIFGKSRK